VIPSGWDHLATTPRAKAALTNCDAVLEDADEHERSEFLRGLNGRTRARRGSAPTSSATSAADELLTAMSADQPATSADLLGRDFFKAIKSLTITGYYTSEVGMKQELGDDGQMFFAEFKGCDHPEHGAPARAAAPVRK
jgi:hypothetical protein